MIQRPKNRSLPEIKDEQDTTVLARALGDLEQAYTATPPADLALAVDRVVGERMTAPRGSRAKPRPLAQGRAVSLAAALLLAVSGVAGYLRLSGPAPVSAQTILHRAAALRLAPDQAAHLTFSVALTDIPRSDGSKGSGVSGTAEVWIQMGAQGTPVLSAQTLTLSKTPAAAASLAGRYLQIGAQSYAYDASHDAILLTPEARANPSWVLPNDLFDGAGTAAFLSTLTPRSQQHIQLLPRQTLDGVSVDVILVDGWTDRPAQRTTLYFDAQSYVLRGFDAVSSDPTYPTPAWHVRLSAQETMAASAVPAGTFALNAPATARVQLNPDKNEIVSAFVGACHTSADVKGIVTQGHQSLLAACQAMRPSVTAASLAAALAAPQQHTLETAVAAGVITPAQAADSLAALRAWLTTWVTSTAARGSTSGETGNTPRK